MTLLTVSSITLLVVLQAFWLKSSYEKSFHDLRRQANLLFRTSVFTLRDSLMSRNIETISDTSAGNESVSWDSIVVRRRHTDHVQVTMDTKDDTVSEASLRPMLSRMFAKVKGERGVQKRFIIRFMPDSLDRDTLALNFRQALVDDGVDVPVSVRRINDTHHRRDRMFPPLPSLLESSVPDSDVSPFRDTLDTEAIAFTPPSHYQASIVSVRSVLLRQIAPQILFSVFLTGMISLAFWMLHRTLRAQRRLMQVKNDFISNITHELKTPIATVSVALEAIRNFHAKNNPQLTADYVSIAQSEVKRLSAMTDRILKISMLENEKSEYTVETFAMDALLDEVLASLKPVFENRNASVHVKKEGQNFMLRGSRVHISYTLYNLLDNALKYSPTQPDIEVTLRNVSSFIEVSVQDRGIGIDETYREKIFEKFFRVPTGDIHNTKGYGLGLSFVQTVVQHHGGRVTLNSVPGEGSTFTIVIPVSPNLSTT